MEGYPMILYDLKIKRPFSKGSNFTSFVDLLNMFIAFFRISRFLSSLWALSFICLVIRLMERQGNYRQSEQPYYNKFIFVNL